MRLWGGSAAAGYANRQQMSFQSTRAPAEMIGCFPIGGSAVMSAYAANNALVSAPSKSRH